jgi:general secretion pathway protein G
MRNLKRNSSGFTLIELVLTIVITGIIATLALRKMSATIESSRYEATKQEMDNIACAIVGNPSTYSNGSRTDFGYVGDVGALPANLDALMSNPGGYSTWNGPYLAAGASSGDFRKDGWNVDYTYTGTLIRSTGSGSTIEKRIAANSAELLNNTVSGYIVDAANRTPGATYVDSLRLSLIYPNGSGGLATVTVNPGADGQFSFSNIPIGQHTVRAIYLPDADTVTYKTTVYPGNTAKLSITFPANLW